MLKAEKKLKMVWAAKQEECVISNSRISIHYPCLNFLANRLDELSERRLGVFVWEIGQGFNYLLDVF